MKHREWLTRYRQAWTEADPAALVDLFTPDAVERTAPFAAALQGVEEITAQFQRTVAAQPVREVALGEPVVDRGTAVAEWWVTLSDTERGDLTVPGLLIASFDEDGRCVELREYWALTEGRHPPFVEWGLVAAGDTRRTRTFADRWVARYSEAWAEGDVDGAVQLFSDDIVYRSHPFRTPERGRTGVRRYTTAAFADERDVRPHMRVVAVSNGVAAVEYWTTRTELDQELTIAGCDILTFEHDGECRALREYWHEVPGILPLPDSWT